MDNRVGYGFRFHRSRWGRSTPTPLKMIVATAESFDVSGGTANVTLVPGDPVARLATGGVTLAAGNETTPVIPFGIVMGNGPYWTGSFMQPNFGLPSDTSWGTILERQSTVWVVPIEEAYWEVDVDDATTATTAAAYQAFINENVSHILSGASGDVPALAKPKLDISTHATTDTLGFRIVGISPTKDNIDFSGANVKLIVEINIGGVAGTAGLATTSKGI